MKAKHFHQHGVTHSNGAGSGDEHKPRNQADLASPPTSYSGPCMTDLIP